MALSVIRTHSVEIKRRKLKIAKSFIVSAVSCNYVVDADFVDVKKLIVAFVQAFVLCADASRSFHLFEIRIWWRRRKLETISNLHIQMSIFSFIRHGRLFVTSDGINIVAQVSFNSVPLISAPFVCVCTFVCMEAIALHCRMRRKPMDEKSSENTSGVSVYECMTQAEYFIFLFFVSFYSHSSVILCTSVFCVMAIKLLVVLQIIAIFLFIVVFFCVRCVFSLFQFREVNECLQEKETEMKKIEINSIIVECWSQSAIKRVSNRLWTEYRFHLFSISLSICCERSSFVNRSV